MEINEYQQQAMETAVYPKTELHSNIFYPTLGLVGEAGEIANKVKKVIRDDNNFLTNEKRQDIIEELSDVLWYCASLASELGVDLNQVCQINLDKLAKRKAAKTLKGSGDHR